VCGLRAGFHLDLPKDWIDSAHVDSASERSSVDQMMRQFEDDGSGDVSASLAATDNQVEELYDDGTPPKSSHDEVPSTLTTTDDRHNLLIPGSVDLIIVD